MAFRGHYEHSVDSKDRVTIPARFRAALSGGVIVGRWLDPCVAVFTAESFEVFSDRFLASLNPLSTRGRQMRTFFYGMSEEQQLDSAGRIHLPKHLMKHAGLKERCVVLGMDDHLEVWDAKTWTAYESELTSTVTETAEQLAASD